MILQLVYRLNSYAFTFRVYVAAQTLVPPSASPMLRNGAPSTFGTISSSSSSSSTYDDPFAF